MTRCSNHYDHEPSVMLDVRRVQALLTFFEDILFIDFEQRDNP